MQSAFLDPSLPLIPVVNPMSVVDILGSDQSFFGVVWTDNTLHIIDTEDYIHNWNISAPLPVGRTCASYRKVDMINFLWLISTPPPSPIGDRPLTTSSALATDVIINDREEALDIIYDNVSKFTFNSQDIPSWSDEQLYYYAMWFSTGMSTDDLCDELRRELNNKGMLIQYDDYK